MTLKNIKKQSKNIAITTLVFFCFIPLASYAEIPNHINYQGKLKDDTGSPITSSTTIQFSLYSHITNGSSTDMPSQVGPVLWTETYDQGVGNCNEITPGTDGIFAQQLGSCVGFPVYLDFTDEYYLGVKIGADAEATPRVSFATNPYAFSAKALHTENEDIKIDTETSGDIVLNSAGNIQLQANDTTSAFIVDQQGTGNLFELQNNGITSFIVDDNGFVGIGESVPTQQLHVAGNMRLEGALYDANNESGTNGQILSSTATGIDWLDVATFMDNIYVANGTLSGDRTVTSNGNLIHFTGTGGNQIIFESNDNPDRSYYSINPDEMEFRTEMGANWASMVFNSGGAYLGHSNGVGANNIYIGNDMQVADAINSRGLVYMGDYESNFIPRSLVTRQYVDGRVGTSIFDTDADTGIQVEANTDEDYVRMLTGGSERLVIRDNGHIAVGGFTGTPAALLSVGGPAEPAVFAVTGSDDYLNIATFRDKMGENVFRAKGSLGDDDLNITFGDYDGAYGQSQMSVNAGTGTGHMDLKEMDLRFYENANGGANYVGFEAPATVAADLIWTLPNSDGALNEALVTDGSGNLSWGAFSSNVTASNGLTRIGNDVQLGGTLIGNTYIEHNGSDLIIREFAGEPETAFTGDNFSIRDFSNDRVIRFGSAGSDSAGLSFEGLVNQHNIYYRDDAMHISSDSLVFEGMQYAIDYSLNYTDRSLVDRGYVNSHIGSTTLQGAADNSIAAEGYVYADLGSTIFEDDGGASVFEAKLGGYETEMRTADGLGIAFRSDDGVGGSGYVRMTDSRGAGNTEGIIYSADYSAGFIDRSLIDKAYVDGAVTSSAFWTQVNDGGIDYLKPIVTHNAITFGSGSDKGFINGDNGMLEMGADVVTIDASSGIAVNTGQFNVNADLRLDTAGTNFEARISSNNLTATRDFEHPDYSGDYVVTKNGGASLNDVLAWNGTAWVTTSSAGIFTKNGTFIYNGGSTANIATDDFVFGSSTMDYGTEANRMFFDKSKAAFRAGQAGGTEWNGSNVGSYSAAFGRGSRASGFASFVAGQYSNATNFGSIVIGNSATASGSNAVVIGGGNATGNNSIAMGSAIEAPSFSEIALGRYSTTYTPNATTTWDENDRLFSVGNGSDSSNRSNALTILKNGAMGIGTDSPVYELEVSGALMLEDIIAPTASAGHSGIYSNGGELYALDASGNSTNISPHDEDGLWHYSSENLTTGKTLEIKMESLMKEFNRMLGGGYVTENGEMIDEGDNLMNNFTSVANQEIEKNTVHLVILAENVDSLTGDIINLTQVTDDHEIRVTKIEELLERENIVIDEEADEEINEEMATELVDDIRNILEKIIFTAEVEFEEATTFISEVIFADEVIFMDRVKYADKDRAGKAIIKEGDKKIEVEFEDEFVFDPYVTAVVNNEFVLFKVTDISENGFIIKIQEESEKDIEFTWNAVSVVNE